MHDATLTGRRGQRFGQRREHCALRQFDRQSQGQCFGFGPRNIAHDADHRVGRAVVRAVKRPQILRFELCHAGGFAKFRMRIRMLAVHRAIQRVFRQLGGLRFHFAQTGQHALLFPRDDGRRINWCLQHTGHHVESDFALTCRRQGAQRDARAVTLESATQHSPDIREPMRDVGLAQSARTLIEQALRQVRKTGFICRVVTAARRKIHCHIEHRNLVTLDKQYLRALRGLPALYGYTSLRVGNQQRGTHPNHPSKIFNSHVDLLAQRDAPVWLRVVADRAPRRSARRPPDRCARLPALAPASPRATWRHVRRALRAANRQ